MDSESKPKYFTAKKWTLIVFLAYNVIIFLLGIIFVDQLVAVISHNENDKEIIKIVYISVFAIATSFNLLLIYGVIKRSICLCITNAVVTAIGTLIYLLLVCSGLRRYSFPTFASFVMTLIAVLYVRDIKYIQRHAEPSSKRLQSV